MELEHFAFFGLDPFMVLGIAVLGSGGVGWLLGPFWGNAIFGIRYRRIRGEIAEVGQPVLLLLSGACSWGILTRC